MNVTDLDYLTYLSTLVTDPEQVIARVYTLDGAGLYRVADDHYVLVLCSDEECKHKGKQLLERVLPREWENFYAAANTDDGFEVYHYGPEA